MRPPKKAAAKRKAAPKPKDTRPQRVRFEEAAKNAGGIDGDAFENAIRKVVPAKSADRDGKSD